MKTKCDARTGLRWGTIVLATLMLPNAGLLGTVAASSSATIDVTSFGAVGDGRTDSTQAFQEAFDEASQYAAPVHVPPGRYLISDHLQLTGSVQLSGSGHRASIITTDGEPGRLMVRHSDTSIRDLGFERMIEPIALVSREGYVLENVRIERCRFEHVVVQARNRGVIGLSSGSSAQRPHRLRYLLVRDCTFRDVDAHAVNIRANISEARILDNQFLNIVNSREDGSRPSGGFAVRLGESSDDARMLEQFAAQGRHRIEGNVIRHMRKQTRGGNLIGLLVYGNYNIIRDNLIEDIDGTAAGNDTNAMYLRGAYNRILGNTIRHIHGADDDGALCLKGGLDQGNQHTVIAHNTIQHVRGMSAVEVSTSHLQFKDNVIEDAPVRGFYHRAGKNLWLQDNTFVDADSAIRTQRGEVLISGNRFLDARIALSQRRPEHLRSHRDAVYIHDNLFQTTRPSTFRALRMANNVEERFVSIRNNRFHNLMEEPSDESGGRLADLVSNATVHEAEVIGNHVIQQGPDQLLFRIGGAAGAGRFADNMIVIHDLRGPILEGAFTAVENNTVRIAADAADTVRLEALFVMTGHDGDAQMGFRNNRVFNEANHVRIGAIIRWDSTFSEGGQVNLAGNVVEGAFDRLARFQNVAPETVVLAGNRLRGGHAELLAGLGSATDVIEQ